MAYETVTGYCWPQSAAPGGTVGLHLSSSGGRPVSVEVARVGQQRTVVLTDPAVPADSHATPPDAASHGCGWPAALAIEVDPSWRSGYFEVVLEIDVDGKRRRSHAFFVVRPDPAATDARILLALATNTWHAYNDFGGRNLYTGGTHVSLQRPMAAGYLHKPPGQGRRVSITNPPDPQMAAHVGYLRLNHLSPYAGSAGWPDWELPFLQWAEREGYAVDVVTNADLEDHPDLLAEGSPYRLYLSVGHDEYWSAPMRDTVEGFIGRGGHAAFFSGNTAFWQVRLEDPTPEGPAATMVGYKGRLKDDPVYGTDRQAELTSIWSDHLIERPENHMTGVSFARGGYHRIGKRATAGAGGYTIHRAGHWLFEGTGLGYGDLLGAGATTVGYECDGCAFTYRDGLPHPTGEDGTPADFVILGTAPAAHFTRTTATRPPAPNEPSELEFIASRLFGRRAAEGSDDAERLAHGHAVLGTYTSAAGGVVVTSGSTDWAHGLAGRDPQVEQITRNVLDLAGDD
ncbi:MAG: N,N-dimethylformamidase beta subunit family domain-containing protein [Acidimicrobiales bacterium]